MVNYKEFLQERYNEIWSSSKEFISSNNIEIDTNLSNIKKDKRFGLTVLAAIKGDVLNNFLEIINQLKEIEPNQYYYPPTDIHITILDFLSCSEDFVFDKNQVELYKKITKKIIQNFPKFNIKFKGLTASKGAVMVQGFFGDELQKLRDSLREEVNKSGIELKEKYKVRTSHSTVVRFKEKLQNPEELVTKIEGLRNFNFGVFEVKKIQFVLHDWYNLKEKTKILAEYELL